MPPTNPTAPSMIDNCIQAALDAGKALGAPFAITSPNQAVVVPAGYRVEPLDPIIAKHLHWPSRLKAIVQLSTLESFMRYVVDFASANTRIFGVIPPSNQPPAFTAILDYHSPRANGKAGAESSPEQPRWCEHVAIYAPRFTEEWTRWMSKNKVQMNQTQLAEFLEENILSVKEPNSAELLELVQNLEGKNDISCSSAIKLANGRIKLTYEENVTLQGASTIAQSNVEFPREVSVALQLFDGGVAYLLKCRLKYRIQSRSISFWFEAVDVHLSIQNAVDDIVKKIVETTKINPLLGNLASSWLRC